MRRKKHLFFVLAALLQPAALANEGVNKASERLASEGFTQKIGGGLQILGREQAHLLRLSVKEGERFGFFAVCDLGCEALELQNEESQIRRENGRILMLKFDAEAAKREVTVEMKNCSSTLCLYRWGLYAIEARP